MSALSKVPDLKNYQGGVYFSQMHALRWQNQSPKTCLDKLYFEMLLQSLQAKSLIVTDSHAAQNSWLRDLLRNNKDYKGLSDLFSEGVVQIARRKGKDSADGIPLTETVRGQIGRVPVVMDGKQTWMTEDFTEHAEILERLTRKTNAPIYDIGDLDLKSKMKIALERKSIYSAYGLEPSIADDLLRRFPQFLNEQGAFMAAKLFALPDQEPVYKEHGDKIKSLATSVHSCNFAISYCLPASTSALAADHWGAMSMYRALLPKYHELPYYDQEDDSGKETRNPKSDLIPKQILSTATVLKIRNTEEFLNFIEARDVLLEACKILDDEIYKSAQQKFTEATWAYVQRIVSLLNISVPDASPKFRQHFTRIEKLAKGENSFWCWLKSRILPGFAVEVIAVQEEQKRIERGKETSRLVLSYTNRILNLLRIPYPQEV